MELTITGLRKRGKLYNKGIASIYKMVGMGDSGGAIVSTSSISDFPFSRKCMFQFFAAFVGGFDCQAEKLPSSNLCSH
jgi:hypothetical protein